MRDNPLRSIWASGGVAWGAWCMNPSTITAELLADVGYDYVCLDVQHGVVGYDAMCPMIQAMRFSPSAAIVRVPSNSPEWIGWALDAGAEGVIVPLVETRAEAERAAAAVRYAPEGSRSYGPMRGGAGAQVDPSRANSQNVCIVMVETALGLENVHDICSTPGVDVVYVGPSDLGVSLGIPPSGWFVDEAHLAAIDDVRSACAVQGVIAGLHTRGADHAVPFAAAGFGMLTVAIDARLLRQSLEHELGVVRSTGRT